MKKILVTGSDDFLASIFIEYYKDKYEIIGLNRSRLDITNESDVFNLFRDNRFDLVFHGQQYRILESVRIILN